MNQDLRKTPRKKPERLVYVEFGSENGGMIRDLSENGMGFRSVGPLRRAEKVPFSFSLEGGEVLRGEAQLVWSESDGRSGGLVFVNVSEEVRGKIRTWCATEGHHPSAPPARIETNSTASTFEELRKELRSQISPAAVSASTAVAQIPAIHGKSQLAAEAAQVRENATSQAEATLQQPVSAERTTTFDISDKTAGKETRQSILSEQALAPEPPVEPKVVEAPHANSEPQISFARSPLPKSPAPPLAPLAFDRGVGLNLESQLPLQGSLTETRWVENLTVSWVIVSMLALTLAAAGFVFRNEVGQAFIWLGAKIAAAPVIQQPPAAEPQVSQPSATPPTSDVSNASQPENPSIDHPASNAPAPRSNVAPGNTTGKAASSEKPKSRETPSASPATSAFNNKAPANAGAATAVRPNDQVAGSGPGADNPLNASPSSAAAGDDENGQNALRQAMEILRSDRRPTDIAEAVRLLWIAVEHGSSQAEVVLAELYRTGEGVSQSCDQTHILLTAAARKGNNEAKSRLVEIAHTGCP